LKKLIEEMRYLIMTLLSSLLIGFGNISGENRPTDGSGELPYTTFIFGTVVDEDDNVMDSVVVSIEENHKFKELRGTRGYLLLDAIEGNTYTLTFKKKGYCTKKIEAVIQENFPIIFFVELFETETYYEFDEGVIKYSRDKKKYITEKHSSVKIGK
jgi:hypothetical protein